MVGELFDVALDMAGRETAGTVGEQRVNGVPSQQRTVVATGHRLLVSALREHAGYTGDNPHSGFQYANAALGILEVVNVGGIVLCTAGRTCYQVSKLTGKGNLRRLRTMQQRQFVEHIRQPLALCLPIDVQTPQRILQRFRAHGNFRCQGLFTQVLQGTAYLEILGEIILPVEAEHAFALHAIIVVGLQ